MGKLEEYINRAKNLAEEAGDAAKSAAEEVMGRAKDLADDHSKVKELTQSTTVQTAASFAMGAKEKVQGVIQDARTVKEIKQGVIELQALPEFEGSIVYSMELEAMINDLNGLSLFIGDGRLDDASVIEEISKVMAKVKPAPCSPADEAAQEEAIELQTSQLTDEEQAIEMARAIAYDACARALAAMNA